MKRTNPETVKFWVVENRRRRPATRDEIIEEATRLLQGYPMTQGRHSYRKAEEFAASWPKAGA